MPSSVNCSLSIAARNSSLFMEAAASSSIHIADSSVPSAKTTASPYSSTAIVWNSASSFFTSAKIRRVTKAGARSTTTAPPAFHSINALRRSKGLAARIRGSGRPTLISLSSLLTAKAFPLTFQRLQVLPRPCQPYPKVPFWHLSGQYAQVIQCNCHRMIRCKDMEVWRIMIVRVHTNPKASDERVSRHASPSKVVHPVHRFKHSV